MIHYDEPKLIRSLETLPNYARVAFAAACAERQMANYAGVNTKPDGFDLVASALDSIWNELMGAPTSDEAFRHHLANCMSAMSEPETEEAIATEDAIASVAYSLRARLAGDSREAAWAARTAYDALDTHVMRRIDTTEITREIKRRVLAHPWVQAELKRQERDLLDLIELTRNKGNAIPMIAKLRERAKEAAQNFMDYSE
jgi:uncharacterized protein YjaG (DUF416 family)